MNRVSDMTRAKMPMHTRPTQRFVLIFVFLIAIGVFYRRKEATARTKTLLSDKVVYGSTLDQHVPLAEKSQDLESATGVENAAVTKSLAQDLTTLTTNIDLGAEQKSDDPCKGRSQPVQIPEDTLKPPSIYFLHIPKTAGTLMHHLVIRYANKTNGLACQYLYDGNRFGPGDYHLSVKPPPTFVEGSAEQAAVDAIVQRNASKKLELLKQGACRAMRGHVTYKQRDYMGQPILSLTVLRDPLERFISMYEFAMMMVRSRPRKSGWDDLISGDIEADFKNASSLLHRGFYDTKGSWIATLNVGFSFHFYGVLHQLSGINPVFEGEGIPEQFRIANAHEMAEKAKDNICSTHILGTQSDMGGILDMFFKTIAPFSDWTEQEIKHAKSTFVNKNAQKKKTADEGWSEMMRAVMQKRFQYETDVYAFALRVIEYRKRFAQISDRNPSAP